jgi:lipoprotein NlpD
MKTVLRLSLLFSLLCGFIFLQTGCSTFSQEGEEKVGTAAPVEDKSLQRNPYSPAGQMLKDTLSEGQKQQPAATPKSSLRFEEAGENNTAKWIWPTDNQIIRRFESGNTEARGIDFAGKVGDSIRAVRSGKVVFSGAGLKGYGQLIIIKHNNNILTAYAHNHNLLVKEGESVDAGQVIAEMGLNEQTGVPMLHFEVRLNGKPVDPLNYLPVRF